MMNKLSYILVSLLSFFAILVPSGIYAAEFDGIYTGYANPAQVSQSIPVKVTVENNRLTGPLIKEFNFAVSESNIEVGIRFDMNGTVETDGLLKGTAEGQAEFGGNGKTYPIGYKGSLSGRISGKTLNFSVHVEPTTTTCPVSVNGKESTVKCSISPIDISGKLEKSGEAGELIYPTVRESEKNDYTTPDIAQVMGEVEFNDESEKSIWTIMGNILKGSNKNWKEAQKGRKLNLFDEISTGTGRAIIQFEDGTKFLLRENSTLRVIHGGFQIDNGSVLFEFKKEGKNIILKEKRGKYSIIGTRFSIDVSDSYTVLRVFEGSVRAQSNDGKSDYEVLAGKSLKSSDSDFGKPEDFDAITSEQNWNDAEQQLSQKEQNAFHNTPYAIPAPVLGFGLGAFFILGIIVLFKNRLAGIILILLPVAIMSYLMGRQNSIPSVITGPAGLPVLSLTPAPSVISSNSPIPTAITPTAASSSAISENNWKTYTDKIKGFSVKHPSDLKPETLPDGDVLISKWGPTQKEQTEFYDGLSIAFRTEPMEGKSFQEAVEERRKTAQEIYGGKITVSPLKLNNLNGLTYMENGYQFIYLPRPNNWLLIITDMSRDPGNLGYETLAKKILQTVELL